VHALGRIHRSLRVGGVLLDVHSEPENAWVEIWQEGRVNPLGQLDEEQDNQEIRLARAELDLVEERGCFVTERRRTFERLAHYQSVDAWLERRAREAATSIIPDAVLDSARRLLAAGSGELVIRGWFRASVLRRSAEHPNWS